MCLRAAFFSLRAMGALMGESPEYVIVTLADKQLKSSLDCIKINYRYNYERWSIIMTKRTDRQKVIYKEKWNRKL